MKKFFSLLKKEIKELLTLQLILPFLIVVLIFNFVGDIIGKQMENTQKTTQSIVLEDKDNSAVSKNIISFLKESKFDLKEVKTNNKEEFVNQIKSNNLNTGVIIPAGFENNLQSQKQQKLETYVVMTGFNFISVQKYSQTQSVISTINKYLSQGLLTSNLPNTSPQFLKQPVMPEENVNIGNTTVQTNAQAVMSFATQQTTFIPIILFMVIMLAAQMIATAIATEKENKTLETLLTMPIDRKYIVSAKMLSAAIVALGMAGVYMFGFRNYMQGLTGGQMGGIDQIKDAAIQLGLVFSTNDYILLGVTLFFGILCALAIAMILGSFAQDVKGVQGIITPLMVMILIPYFLTLFIDFNSLSKIAQYAVYAIPFTHPFIAGPNIMLENYNTVYYGIIYQAVVFIIFVVIAAKIFSSDYILTMNLNFGKKK